MFRKKLSGPGSEADPEEKQEARTVRYVRYSPVSLLLLSLCAFVFSFSMFGLFEQSLLDTAGGATASSLSGLAFEGGGNTDPSQKGELTPSAGPVGQWQEILSSDIDPESLPYLQTVNFNALKQENKDTVCWMYWPTTTDVKGLPINLPVVQTEDNEYYLTHSFDNTYSENGWVYADYRCNMSDLLSNRNLILYGHARSYLVFGGLKYLNTKTKWQQDGYNQYIYVNTATERTVWQVFSWYETTVDFNYINTYFSDDAELVEFLNTLQSKNQISSFEQFSFSARDRILTLSTCKGSDENVRVAVHAVLVKYERISSGMLPGEDTTTTDSKFETEGDPWTETETDGEVTESGSSDSHITDTGSGTEGMFGTDSSSGSGTSSGGAGGETIDTGTPTDRPGGSASGGSSTEAGPSTDTGTPTDTEPPSGSSSPSGSGGLPPTDSGGSDVQNGGTPSDVPPS